MLLITDSTYISLSFRLWLAMICGLLTIWTLQVQGGSLHKKDVTVSDDATQLWCKQHHILAENMYGELT